MIVDVDGFDIDVTQFSKKIVFKYNDNKKPEITFTLDFPPYTETREFENQEKAEAFIAEIKSDEDKVRYE